MSLPPHSATGLAVINLNLNSHQFKQQIGSPLSVSLDFCSLALAMSLRGLRVVPPQHGFPIASLDPVQSDPSASYTANDVVEKLVCK